MELLSTHLQVISQTVKPEKNKELAIVESTLPQNSDKFALAISLPKIRELTNIEPLKEALRVAMIIVGLRGQNFPNDMEKALLLNHILKYFGGHTPEEIRLAFEMAVCGQLELSFDEVTSYENFSVIYFSKIMTAYRNWAEVEYRQTIKDETPTQTIYSQDDLDNLHRGDIETFYQRCRNGITPYAIPEYFKEILVKDGLMEKEDTTSTFFMNKLGVGSKNIYVK